MTVSRNDPCPCGSGLKYKKCCLGAEPVSKIKARRQLTVAWVVVAIVAVTCWAVWGSAAGAASGLGASALVGAWVLMHDTSEGSGSQSGSILGTSGSGSGAVDRKSRAAGPPVKR